MAYFCNFMLNGWCVLVIKKSFLFLHQKNEIQRDAQTIRTIRTYICADVQGDINDFPFYTLTPGIQEKLMLELKTKGSDM